MRQIVLFAVVLAVLGGGIWFAVSRDAAPDESARTVRVTRGDVVRKAVAVGRIGVEHEVPVKSRHGGILTRLRVKLGQRVEAGDPVAEVRPVITPETILTAERAVELASDAKENAREFLDGEHPAGHLTRWFTGKNNLERMQKAADLGLQQAEERLELLKEGEVIVDGRKVDYTIRAPAAGHVLRLDQREGAPVVPSSSYGSGSVLVTIGDLGGLVFRGTVDEIDVGQLREGMTARLRIGALRGADVAGKLSEIELQGTTRENAVVFGVRIDLDKVDDLVLRSGYSAVAEIDVDRRDGVLTLSERVVEFREGRASVSVVDGDGRSARREIVTGLSDGLTLEVVSGLSEGQEVLERSFRADP